MKKICESIICHLWVPTKKKGIAASPCAIPISKVSPVLGHAAVVGVPVVLGAWEIPRLTGSKAHHQHLQRSFNDGRPWFSHKYRKGDRAIDAIKSSHKSKDTSGSDKNIEHLFLWGFRKNCCFSDTLPGKPSEQNEQLCFLFDSSERPLYFFRPKDRICN